MAHASKLQEVVDETSALSQKRTFRNVRPMSALHPKADIAAMPALCLVLSDRAVQS
jgi:hypothetical protein